MKKRYTGLRLGLVAILLAGAIFSTDQAFAEEDAFMGVSRDLVLDDKYIIFPVVGMFG